VLISCQTICKTHNKKQTILTIKKSDGKIGKNIFLIYINNLHSCTFCSDYYNKTDINIFSQIKSGRPSLVQKAKFLIF
jgi:hypothetical protein